MPYVVDPYEHQLLRTHHSMVVTTLGVTYQCSKCKKGSMSLFRKIDSDGNFSAALFGCSTCDFTAKPFPDGNGAVRPAPVGYGPFTPRETSPGKWS